MCTYVRTRQMSSQLVQCDCCIMWPADVTQLLMMLWYTSRLATMPCAAPCSQTPLSGTDPRQLWPGVISVCRHIAWPCCKPWLFLNCINSQHNAQIHNIHKKYYFWRLLSRYIWTNKPYMYTVKHDLSVNRSSVISGFRREAAENCALLSHYTASSGDSLPMFRDNLSVPSSGFRD